MLVIPGTKSHADMCRFVLCATMGAKETAVSGIWHVDIGSCVDIVSQCVAEESGMLTLAPVLTLLVWVLFSTVHNNRTPVVNDTLLSRGKPVALI